MNKLVAFMFYLFAFLCSAAVTYILPGTNEDTAFIDVMGAFISISFFVAAVIHLINSILDDISNPGEK